MKALMKKIAEMLKLAATTATTSYPEKRDPAIDVEHTRMSEREKILSELQARVRVIERRYK